MQLAYGVEHFQIQPSQNDQLVLAALDKFGICFRKLGYKNQLVSRGSLERLYKLDDSKKLEMASQLIFWQETLSSSIVEEKFPGFDEKVSLKKALDYLGLQIHDDFWKTIESDHIVEVYSSEMKQVYRSINFFDVCGYSVLDLFTYEWFVLWERPKQVLDQLKDVTMNSLTDFVSVRPVGAPAHILKEVCDTGLTEPFEPKICSVDFLNIGSLINKNDGSIGGFIATSKGFELNAASSKKLFFI